MSDKKWYENIPEQGVLCTNFEEMSNDIPFVVVTNNLMSSATEDDLKNIRLATPSEWWQFAPWRDMKDAPNSEIILLSFDDNQYRADYSDLLLNGFYANKWLPLPEE